MDNMKIGMVGLCAILVGCAAQESKSVAKATDLEGVEVVSESAVVKAKDVLSANAAGSSSVAANNNVTDQLDELEVYIYPQRAGEEGYLIKINVD